MSLKKIMVIGAVTLGLSAGGERVLKQYEGYRGSVYADLGGVDTACWGTTNFDKGKQRFTRAECQRYFDRDVQAFATKVNRYLKVPVTQEEFDALVIFAYNVGDGALLRSQLLRYLNAGDCLQAGAEFPKWAYVRSGRSKRLVLGVLNRRFEEQHLFTQGCMKRLGV